MYPHIWTALHVYAHTFWFAELSHRVSQEERLLATFVLAMVVQCWILDTQYLCTEMIMAPIHEPSLVGLIKQKCLSYIVTSGGEYIRLVNKDIVKLIR